MGGGGKKKGGRLKGRVPNANFLAHVLVCLCQKQSFGVGKRSKKQEISSANKSLNISNLHPQLVSGNFCGRRSAVEKNCISKRTVSLISSFSLPVGAFIILGFQQTLSSFTAE